MLLFILQRYQLHSLCSCFQRVSYNPGSVHGVWSPGMWSTLVPWLSGRGRVLLVPLLLISGEPRDGLIETS